MKARHVALIGYYGHGNFGDECYATLFSRALREAGFSTSICHLTRRHAGPFGRSSGASIDELLEGADVLLWGGGGLLVPWHNLVYRAFFPGVAAQAQEATDRAIRNGIRLAASSVGGDGSCVRRLAPAYKDRFIRAASFATVRNPQDVSTLKRLGVQGEYFPDLIWLAGEGYSPPARKSGGVRIAFDLYRSTLVRNFAPYLLPALQQLVNERKDCHFYFVDSTLDSVRPYAGLGGLVRGANVVHRQFSGFENDIEFLSSLDLLVSSRLHVPMVALQYGVPVLSLFAEKKTTLAFSNLGLSRLCFGHRRTVEFYRLLARRETLECFLRDFPFPDIQALRAAATGHLRLLTEWLAGGSAR